MRCPRFLALALLAASCSGGAGGAGGMGGVGGAGGGGQGGGIQISDAGDGAACMALSEMHADGGASHVGADAAVSYNSNPPSSGSHCGSWGAYAAYGAGKPLPRCNYVHNLEHGAVVLLYNCPGGCPDVLSRLTALRDAAQDPNCPKARVILTPDAEIETQVAAAAWRFTWKAACLDAGAAGDLDAFIRAHLGSAGLAPEASVCADGAVTP